MSLRASTGKRRKVTDIVQAPWQRVENPLPHLSLVSEDEVEYLFSAALRVLDETGLRCPVAEAQDVLRRGGARVGDDHRVRIGGDMVAAALATAPKNLTLTPRNADRAVSLGGRSFTTAAVLGPPNVTDLVRGRRSGTLADMEELLKLTQYFNAVQMNGWPVEPLDCEVKVRHLDAAYSMLTLTDKVPYVFCQSRRRIEDVLTLCAMARGETLAEFSGRPGVFSIINTNTPLHYDVPMTIGVMDMARHGQPTLLTPFVMAGASTPNSLASALVLNTAEVLFGVVLAQLVRPGAPVVYGCAAMNVDMRTGAPAYGWADMQRFTIVGGQMARRCGLPMRSSNFSTSNVPDFLSGMESSNTGFAALASGAHLLMHAAGWAEGGLCTSYEKFVLDCEIVQSLMHMASPVDLSDAALALDEIASVGPGGHFFGSVHTLETYETAFYRPMVASTQNYGAWAEAGAKDAAVRAAAIWQEALRTYEMPPLEEARREAMAEFVAKRKEEGGAPLD